MKLLKSTSYSILGAAMLAAAPSVHAQEDDGGIADIVVTATKMGETRLQATPIAVTALSSDDMASRGIRDVQDLKALVPSLQVADLSGYTQMFVRGIGSNIVFIGSDPSTTLHLDGVYLGRPMSYMNDFLDVERVEVLRGPQGTIYGRNSVGGTVNVISRKPSTTPLMELRAEYGTYDRYALKAYATAPIGDGGAAFSIAGDVSGHDAFRENISTGDDMESLRSRGVRGQLLLPFGGVHSLTLRADYGHQSGSMGAYPKLLGPIGDAATDGILGDPDKVALDAPAHTVMRNYGFAGELDIAVSDDITLRSVTAYRGLRGNIQNDSDSSPLSILPINIGPIRQNQFSQEINLIGKNDLVDWVVGAFYFDEKNREDLTLAIVPENFTHVQRPHLRAKSLGLFAQTEWHLTEQLSFVAGLRYTKEKKSYQLLDKYVVGAISDPALADQAPVVMLPGATPNDPLIPWQFTVDTSRKDDAFTPKFGLNYKPNDNVMVYASATRGFKSGGYDFGALNYENSVAGFAPEKLWSYEAGIKSDWFGRRLRANLTGFYYDYKDLQVQGYLNDGLAFGATTNNAASARVKGLELELLARPLSGFSLSANLAYLDATYKNFTDASVGQLQFDASGKRLNNAPKWAGTIGAAYELGLADGSRIEFGADLRFQSKIYFTALNGGGKVVDNTNSANPVDRVIANYLEQQRGYEVVSARIGWKDADDRFGINLFASNLFDKNYIVGTANYTPAISARQGRPREIVGQVSMKF
ncbi:TonB-dependent receptor [Sphingopyxis yananensis]|uniref:TonB-dependent receptor n=1 Tax=Sphingopyxis yananensis TaxID=2886687 RepID=UPI001D12F895|nr:TonB-dependent receptor [Sphingopyxis yananensis]MCC2603701.1 TonB-dependent receptor [Sphingopyxis yananensis]